MINPMVQAVVLAVPGVDGTAGCIWLRLTWPGKVRTVDSEDQLGNAWQM